MAKTDRYDDICFLHQGSDIRVYPCVETASFESVPEPRIPVSALISVVLGERRPDPVLRALLLNKDGEALIGCKPHPSVRRDGTDHVIVTGPDQTAIDMGEESREATHRIPYSAVREFVYNLLLGSIISRVEQLDTDELERLGNLILPPLPG